MNDYHVDAPLRQRTLLLADDERAEFRLSNLGERVKYDIRRLGGSSGGEWPACPVDQCWGQAIEPGFKCFVHASDMESATYLERVSTGQAAFRLNGNELSEVKWRQVLEVLNRSTGATASPSVIMIGAVFNFPLMIETRQFLGDVDFTGATFRDGFYMKDVTFSRHLNLSFVRSSSGSVRLDECGVARLLTLDYADSEQQLALNSCKLEGGVQAQGVVGELRIEECEIAGKLLLDRLNVGILSIERTKIHGELAMESVTAKTVLATKVECSSSSPGSIAATYSVDLTRARFGERVDFQISASEVNLTGSNFVNGGRIGVKSAKIIFDRTVFGAAFTVDGDDAARITGLRNTDLSYLHVASVDLGRCVMSEASGLAEISIESTSGFSRAPTGWRASRSCIADEHIWRVQRGGRWARDWKLVEDKQGYPGAKVIPPPVLSAAKVSATYRSLRSSLESRANEPGAADFYYGEMEMRRLDSRSSVAERAILTAYWLLSGYGLRALRTVVAIVAVVVIAALVIKNFGTNSPMTIVESGVYALESMIPGSKADPALNIIGRITGVALKVIGPVLIALAAIAIRNRVRRSRST